MKELSLKLFKSEMLERRRRFVTLFSFLCTLLNPQRIPSLLRLLSPTPPRVYEDGDPLQLGGLGDLMKIRMGRREAFKLITLGLANLFVTGYTAACSGGSSGSSQIRVEPQQSTIPQIDECKTKERLRLANGEDEMLDLMIEQIITGDLERQITSESPPSCQLLSYQNNQGELELLEETFLLTFSALNRPENSLDTARLLGLTREFGYEEGRELFNILRQSKNDSLIEWFKRRGLDETTILGQAKIFSRSSAEGILLTWDNGAGRRYYVKLYPEGSVFYDKAHYFARNLQLTWRNLGLINEANEIIFLNNVHLDGKLWKGYVLPEMGSSLASLVKEGSISFKDFANLLIKAWQEILVPISQEGYIISDPNPKNFLMRDNNSLVPIDFDTIPTVAPVVVIEDGREIRLALYENAYRFMSRAAGWTRHVLGREREMELLRFLEENGLSRVEYPPLRGIELRVDVPGKGRIKLLLPRAVLPENWGSISGEERAAYLAQMREQISARMRESNKVVLSAYGRDYVYYLPNLNDKPSTPEDIRRAQLMVEKISRRWYLSVALSVAPWVITLLGEIINALEFDKSPILGFWCTYGAPNPPCLPSCWLQSDVGATLPEAECLRLIGEVGLITLQPINMVVDKIRYLLDYLSFILADYIVDNDAVYDTPLESLKLAELTFRVSGDLLRMGINNIIDKIIKFGNFNQFDEAAIRNNLKNVLIELLRQRNYLLPLNVFLIGDGGLGVSDIYNQLPIYLYAFPPIYNQGDGRNLIPIAVGISDSNTKSILISETLLISEDGEKVFRLTDQNGIEPVEEQKILIASSGNYSLYLIKQEGKNLCGASDRSSGYYLALQIKPQ